MKRIKRKPRKGGFPSVKDAARAAKQFKKDFPEDCGWKDKRWGLQ